MWFIDVWFVQVDFEICNCWDVDLIFKDGVFVINKVCFVGFDLCLWVWGCVLVEDGLVF